MRTTAQRQIPLNNADMLLHEFFGQEQLQSGSKTSFHGTKLRSELQDYTSWASEFEHHKIQDLSLADKELMDQVYKQHQAPSGTSKQTKKIKTLKKSGNLSTMAR